MPKPPRPAMDPAVLLTPDIDRLHPDLAITPAEVRILLSCSDDELKDRRRDGRPPPFIAAAVKGGAIRYRLGDVLEARRQRPVVKNHRQAESVRTAHGLGLDSRFATFAAFMDGAHLDDTWPFKLVAYDRPVDYIGALGVESGRRIEDGDPCLWLRLDDYLSRRGNAERLALADAVSATLAATTSRPTNPPPPSDDGRF